ncbi:MAG: hypothetical protein ACOCVA_08420, partial [Prolixibacteraceae bacterium]
MMRNCIRISIYGLMVLLSWSCISEKNEKLAYSQDFEKAGAINEFLFAEPMKWQISADSLGNSFLEAKEKGSYEPPHRSPFLITLIDSISVSDFVLEVDLMQ